MLIRAVVAVVTMLLGGAVLPSLAIELERQGDVFWVSGGVSADEQGEMIMALPDHNLKVVTAAEKSGAFLAAVQVVVRDAGGWAVLETSLDGPWLFVRLPPGRYELIATYAGRSQTRSFTVPVTGRREIALTGPRPTSRRCPKGSRRDGGGPVLSDRRRCSSLFSVPWVRSPGCATSSTPGDQASRRLRHVPGWWRRRPQDAQAGRPWRNRDAAPLYTVRQAIASLGRLRSVEIDEPVRLHPSVSCVFRTWGTSWVRLSSKSGWTSTVVRPGSCSRRSRPAGPTDRQGREAGRGGGRVAGGIDLPETARLTPPRAQAAPVCTSLRRWRNQ